MDLHLYDNSLLDGTHLGYWEKRVRAKTHILKHNLIIVILQETKLDFVDRLTITSPCGALTDLVGLLWSQMALWLASL